VTDQDQQLPLQRLAFLEGSWVNTGNVAAGPFGPGGEISGCSVYRWDLGKAWLTYKSELDLPGFGAYEVSGGFSFDVKRTCYIAFAANSMGNLLTYDGHWENDSSLIFLQVFPLPGGLARVRYLRSEDGTVRMFSEKRSEAGDFEAYFETTMKPHQSQ
jgi:hypothetical protein